MKIKLTNKILIPAVIVIAAVICGALVIWSVAMPEGDTIVIHKGDKIVEEIRLSGVEEPYEIDLGTNVVYIEKDGASVISADCPDKICMHTGKITSNSGAIICAPNRVMVEFRGGETEVDALAGGR